MKSFREMSAGEEIISTWERTSPKGFSEPVEVEYHQEGRGGTLVVHRATDGSAIVLVSIFPPQANGVFVARGSGEQGLISAMDRCGDEHVYKSEYRLSKEDAIAIAEHFETTGEMKPNFDWVPYQEVDPNYTE